MTSNRSTVARLYLAGYRGLEGMTRLVSGVYTGVWLGAFRSRDLHRVSELKYERAGFYRTEGYNRWGLWECERRVVERHFTACRRLIVLAAGGGREVLALRLLGLSVDGFEADARLVEFANGLLEKEGLVADIERVPWDECPPGDRRYDGGIVGWSGYMHIRGRARRVAFLRQLRSRLETGAPVLLSFHARMGRSRFFPVVARVGNLTARMLGRERVEVGDCLIPSFAHFFTRKELERELAEAGFELLEFETAEYGHAVARTGPATGAKPVV